MSFLSATTLRSTFLPFLKKKKKKTNGVTHALKSVPDAGKKKQRTVFVLEI